jgi:hypothetical protein
MPRIDSFQRRCTSASHAETFLSIRNAIKSDRSIVPLSRHPREAPAYSATGNLSIIGERGSIRCHFSAVLPRTSPPFVLGRYK